MFGLLMIFLDIGIDFGIPDLDVQLIVNMHNWLHFVITCLMVPAMCSHFYGAFELLEERSTPFHIYIHVYIFVICLCAIPVLTLKSLLHRSSPFHLSVRLYTYIYRFTGNILLYTHCEGGTSQRRNA